MKNLFYLLISILLMSSCDTSDNPIEPDPVPVEYIEFNSNETINSFDFIKEYTDNQDAIDLIRISIPEYPKAPEDRIYLYDLEKEIFTIQDIFDLNKNIDYDQNNELKFTLYLKVSYNDVPQEKIARGYYPISIKITKI